jgi:hypothetical protein
MPLRGERSGAADPVLMSRNAPTDCGVADFPYIRRDAIKPAPVDTGWASEILPEQLRPSFFAGEAQLSRPVSERLRWSTPGPP